LSGTDAKKIISKMVSYSTTTAIVYALSGFTFFFLIFLLIMVGLDCCAKCCPCLRKKKVPSIRKQNETETWLNSTAFPDLGER